MYQLSLNKVITLFVLTLFIFSTELFAEENIKEQEDQQRTITLKGKADPRLSIWVKSTYKPTNFDNKEECYSNSEWITGRKKGILDWAIVSIIPDKNNEYEVNMPIDYVGDNKCGYEYSNTEIQIRRDKYDELWASFTIASSKSRALNVYSGDKTGSSSFVSGGRPIMPRNTRRHFQLPDNSRIVCLTTHYERSKKGGHVFPERNTFACFEQYDSVDNGVDELKTTTINLDIEIDEERCLYITSSDDSVKSGEKKKDYFRDYKRKDTLMGLKEVFKKLFD